MSPLSELYRRPGQVGYRVKVTLKADAPVGAIKGDIFLRTNDPASPLLPVLMEATVQSNITVAPANVSLGTVKIGESLTRRVVVRGNKPFRVLQVEGLRDGITLDPAPSSMAATVQVVTFKCQFTKAGDFKQEVKIKTDAARHSRRRHHRRQRRTVKVGITWRHDLRRESEPDPTRSTTSAG